MQLLCINFFPLCSFCASIFFLQNFTDCINSKKKKNLGIKCLKLIISQLFIVVTFLVEKPTLALTYKQEKFDITVTCLLWCLQDVEEIEEYRSHTQQRQKRLVGYLVLYSIVLYLIAALVCYFYYFPDNLQHQLLYAMPFIVFPFL